MIRNLIQTSRVWMNVKHFHTPSPTALEILKYGDDKYNRDLRKSVTEPGGIYVSPKSDCYECYNLMEKNKLSYIPIIDRKEKKIIGILNWYDVKEYKLFHEYKNKEDEGL